MLSSIEVNSRFRSADCDLERPCKGDWTVLPVNKISKYSDHSLRNKPFEIMIINGKFFCLDHVLNNDAGLTSPIALPLLSSTKK